MALTKAQTIQATAAILNNQQGIDRTFLQLPQQFDRIAAGLKANVKTVEQLTLAALMQELGEDLVKELAANHAKEKTMLATYSADLAKTVPDFPAE